MSISASTSSPMSFAERMAWIFAFTSALAFAGLIVGFFGPMLFQPNSNQGPLLGIFVTAPLGAAIGFVLGLIVSIVTTSRRRLILTLAIASGIYGGGLLLALAFSPDPGSSTVHQSD